MKEVSKKVFGEREEWTINNTIFLDSNRKILNLSSLFINLPILSNKFLELSEIKGSEQFYITLAMLQYDTI